MKHSGSDCTAFKLTTGCFMIVNFALNSWFFQPRYNDASVLVSQRAAVLILSSWFLHKTSCRDRLHYGSILNSALLFSGKMQRNHKLFICFRFCTTTSSIYGEWKHIFWSPNILIPSIISVKWLYDKQIILICYWSCQLLCEKRYSHFSIRRQSLSDIKQRDLWSCPDT